MQWQHYHKLFNEENCVWCTCEWKHFPWSNCVGCTYKWKHLARTDCVGCTCDRKWFRLYNCIFLALLYVFPYLSARRSHTTSFCRTCVPGRHIPDGFWVVWEGPPYRPHSLGDGSRCRRGKGLKTICLGPTRTSVMASRAIWHDTPGQYIECTCKLTTTKSIKAKQ